MKKKLNVVSRILFGNHSPPPPSLFSIKFQKSGGMSVFPFLMPTSSQVSKCQVYVAGLGQDPWKNQPTPHIFFSKIKAEFEWSPSKHGKAPNHIFLFLYVIIKKNYLSTLDPRKNMIFDQRYCRQLFTKFIKNNNAMEEVSFSTVGIC